MESYLESICAEPYTILGRPLRSLTLGHLLLLNRLKVCPVQDNDDLMISVLICSTDATKLDDIFDDRFFDLKFRWWNIRLGKVDWYNCHKLWTEYFTLHNTMPSWASNSKSKSSPSGTPFLQTIKITLQSKCGYSPEEALSYPFQQCLWDYLSYHELEGNIDILDKEDRESKSKLADEQHDQLVKSYLEGELNGGK